MLLPNYVSIYFKLFFKICDLLVNKIIISKLNYFLGVTLMTHDVLKKKLEDIGKGNVSDSKIEKMIDLFSTQLLLTGEKGLVTYYERASNIPDTLTRAVLNETYGGLSLDGIIPQGHGGRSELIRAFRDTDVLILKIPFNNKDAEQEISFFKSIGLYNPHEQCVIGPVQGISIKRVGRSPEIGLLMPFLTSPLSLVPKPVNDSLLQLTITSLVKSLEFVHSKGYIHCDVKDSNLMLHNNNVYLIDFGSAIFIGGDEKEPNITTTTVVNIPDYFYNNVDKEVVTEHLDWFQAALLLLTLICKRPKEEKNNCEEVCQLLEEYIPGSEHIRMKMMKRKSGK